MDVPKTLGKYEIRGTLGRGAMGVVFDGFDPQIARRVAVKSVPLPSSTDPETQEEIARFRREAQAAGRLTHPNIVTVHDYGETADVAYIVMEHIDGPTLKALLDKQERFPLARVGRIMDDVLAGLQFSHERGVVHRDIKPGNIMLTAAGQAKIADFGIARIEASSMTQAGTMLGTPAYMSPEQFRGEPADARTDVYSAGVLLYQLLTGERPFEGGLTAIMHKALNTEPPAPSDLSGSLPRALDAVVRKAMAKRPQDRFASAAAFAEALRPALSAPVGAEDATVVRPSGPPPPAGRVAPAAKPPPPAAAGKSRLPLFAGAAVVALLVLGGAAWLLTRPAGSPPVQPPAVAEVQPVAPAPPHPVQPAEPTVAPAPATPPRTTPAQTAPTTPPRVQPPTTAEVQPVAPTAPQQVQPAEPTVAPTPEPPVAAKPVTPAAPPPAPKPVEPNAATLVEPTAPLTTTTSLPLQTTTPAPLITAVPAAPPAAPPANAPPPAGTQTASIAPAAMLQQIAQALHGARCALADAVVQDGGGLAVSGLADAATAASLRHQIGDLPGMPPVAWRMQTVDPAFCTALSLLRPISPLAGAPGPGVGLTLRENRTVLQDGEPILPRVTMPDFDGEVRVDYLGHDGSLAHLFPTLAEPAAKRTAQPSRRLAAGERLALGDPGPGKPRWESGAPYGTDMIIVVASSAPLRVAAPHNNEDKADAYLAELERAIEQARAAGARVSGALLLVDAVPKAR